MNSELINEIYEKFKIENSLENQIEFIENKNLKLGLTKEHFYVNQKVDNLGVGVYTIFNFQNVFDNKDNQIYLIEKLSIELKKFLSKMNTKKILIVGLGNRHISADSLGAKVVKNIIVTRHIKNLKSLKNVSTICPSVLGLTGIESYDIVKSIIEITNPTLVITIDSLCASSATRLGTSFQINNAEIIPGGGINNKRKIFNSKTLHTDFLSIGVPLVIYANTFCNSPKRSLNNLVVTPKDIEEVSFRCANILSYSLNMAIHNITLNEVKDFLNKI